MRIVLSFFIFFFSFTIYAKQNFGLGLNAYSFMGDLKDQMNATIGLASEYEYTLFPKLHYKPAIGVRAEIYSPVKNGFRSFNFLLTPEASMVFYKGKLDVGATVGFDVLYWRQSKTYLFSNTTLEELDFGLSFGVFSNFPMNHGNFLKVMLLYHIQEYNVKTTYLSLGGMYVWNL